MLLPGCPSWLGTTCCRDGSRTQHWLHGLPCLLAAKEHTSCYYILKAQLLTWSCHRRSWATTTLHREPDMCRRCVSLVGPTAPLVTELLQLPVPGCGAAYRHISEMLTSCTIGSGSHGRHFCLDNGAMAQFLTAPSRNNLTYLLIAGTGRGRRWHGKS